MENLSLKEICTSPINLHQNKAPFKKKNY